MITKKKHARLYRQPLAKPQIHHHIVVDCTHQGAVYPIHQGGNPIEHCNKHILARVALIQGRDLPFGYWRIETRYTQCGIARWWSKSLHTDEPRWWCKWRDRQSLNKFWREITGSFFLQRCFEFFAFVIPSRQMPHD